MGRSSKCSPCNVEPLDSASGKGSVIGAGPCDPSLFACAMQPGSHANDIVVADFVIAGAGTAGSPLAHFLSLGGTSVHVIEGGQRRNDNPTVLNPASVPGVLDGLPEFNWVYPANVAPLVTSPFNPNIGFQEGRGWGGSSMHNYLLNVRGTPGNYDRWATIGGAQWSYNSLLPSMLYMEHYTDNGDAPVDPTQRGTTGPLFITENALNPMLAGYIAALAANGMPFSTDYNNPNVLGSDVSGYDQLYVTPTQPPKRSWAATAWLGADTVEVDADGDGVGINGHDLFVASNAVAIRLLFRDDFSDAELQQIAQDHGLDFLNTCDACGKKSCPSCNGSDGADDGDLEVVGVRYIKGDRIIDAIARKETILATGSIEDPLLLQRSGIGPQVVFDRTGIAPRLVNENVGRNLQDHVGFLAVIPTDPAITPGGPQLEAFSDLSTEGQPVTGLREFQLTTIFSAAGSGKSLIVGFGLKPAASGTTELRTAAFPSDPLITFNFYSTQDEKDKVVAALKVVRDVSIANGFGPPISPAPIVYAGGDAALFTWALQPGNWVVSNHNSGTCRMATSAATGVVDPDLKVFGAKRLRVSSNSIVPFINDGNTSYTAYTVGLHTAKILGAPVPF